MGEQPFIAEICASFDRKLVGSVTNRTDAEKAIHCISRDQVSLPAIVWCQSPYQLFAMPLLLRAILTSSTLPQFQAKIATIENEFGRKREFCRFWKQFWSGVRPSSLPRSRDHSIDILGVPGILSITREMYSHVLAVHSKPTELLEVRLNRRCKREFAKLIFADALQSLDDDFRTTGFSAFVNNRLIPKGQRIQSILPAIRDNWIKELSADEDSLLSEIWWNAQHIREAASARANVLSSLVAQRIIRGLWLSEWVFDVLSCYEELVECAIALSLFPQKSSTLKQEFDVWLNLLENCNQLVVLPGIAFVCERPISFDAQIFGNGRDEAFRQSCHNSNGPIISFADGLQVYMLDNSIVPSKLVDDPSSLTLEDIESCRNVESRRKMIEMYGMSRYVADAVVIVRDQNELGALYVKNTDDDEPLTIVKVRNSTPEPDGSYKFYFLRVPPTVRTVREAIAWTFGLEADEYHPTQET